MAILIVLFVGLLPNLSLAEENRSPETLFIEIADESFSSVSCDTCPTNVGKMIIARPMRLGQIQQASDIQLHTCNFTMVSSDIAMTASHCLFGWTGGWDKEADGDCSQTFGFYRPGQPPGRCLKILKDSEANRRLLHTRPDTAYIQLQAPDAHWNSQLPLENAATPTFEIWGSADDRHILEKRTCREVEKSVLSPLKTAGVAESAFRTLSCDGPIVEGWSGAGVFQGGKLIGNVSQAVSDTVYSPSVFGKNEVTVSLQKCSPLNVETEVAPQCYATQIDFSTAVLEAHFQQFDNEVHWQNSMIQKLEKSFQGLRFTYQTRVSSNLLKDRGFAVHCIEPQWLENFSKNEVLDFVHLQVDKIHQKYLIYGPHSQLIGFHGMGKTHPVVGRFFANMDFKKQPSEKTDDGILMFQSGESSKKISVCEGAQP